MITQSQPDETTPNVLATGIFDANIMRGMGLVPVNPRTETSIMGQGSDTIDRDDDAATRLTNDDGNTPDDR